MISWSQIPYFLITIRKSIPYSKFSYTYLDSASKMKWQSFFFFFLSLAYKAFASCFHSGPAKKSLLLRMRIAHPFFFALFVWVIPSPILSNISIIPGRTRLTSPVLVFFKKKYWYASNNLEEYWDHACQKSSRNFRNISEIFSVSAWNFHDFKPLII